MNSDKLAFIITIIVGIIFLIKGYIMYKKANMDSVADFLIEYIHYFILQFALSLCLISTCVNLLIESNLVADKQKINIGISRENNTEIRKELEAKYKDIDIKLKPIEISDNIITYEVTYNSLNKDVKMIDEGISQIIEK